MYTPYTSGTTTYCTETISVDHGLSNLSHRICELFYQIEDAVKYTKLALKYYSDHVHSLHLLVLLLTAQKHYQ